jgi:plastocyanin
MPTRKTRYALTLLAATGMALALMAGADAPEREIVLEARDMAFFVAGQSEPNPTLELAPGESIRLTFVNHDRGIDHDLTMRDLGLATAVLAGDGSSASLEFRAPRASGEHDYTCELHDRMMRGRLVVR